MLHFLPGVLDENERLLYLTSLITNEWRQFTPDEVAQVKTALPHLDMMQLGVIPLHDGGFSWIDPAVLADQAHAEALERAHWVARIAQAVVA